MSDKLTAGLSSRCINYGGRDRKSSRAPNRDSCIYSCEKNSCERGGGQERGIENRREKRAEGRTNLERAKRKDATWLNINEK